jgi:hypothetical protein
MRFILVLAYLHPLMKFGRSEVAVPELHGNYAVLVFIAVFLPLPRPPANPALRAIALRSSAVSFFLRALPPSAPRATAAGFFFLGFCMEILG